MHMYIHVHHKAMHSSQNIFHMYIHTHLHTCMCIYMYTIRACIHHNIHFIRTSHTFIHMSRSYICHRFWTCLWKINKSCCRHRYVLDLYACCFACKHVYIYTYVCVYTQTRSTSHATDTGIC